MPIYSISKTKLTIDYIEAFL